MVCVVCLRLVIKSLAGYLTEEDRWLAGWRILVLYG
jgi:hypothetical protein